MKLWLYESWVAKQDLELERSKHHAILTGSFFNPEAAQKMLKKPEHMSSDEEFDTSFEMAMAMDQGMPEGSAPPRRRRKVIRE